MRISDSIKIKSIKDKIKDSAIKILHVSDSDSLKKTDDSLLEKPKDNFFILTSGTDSSWLDIVNTIVPLIFSLLAFIFSLIAVSREKSYKDLAFLAEADKMFVDDPELWMIYDSDRQKHESLKITIANPAGDEEWKLEAKLIAFCYYELNNFEIALERNTNLYIEEAWEYYMIHTILHSTLFKKVVTKETNDFIYSIKFRKKLKGFLDMAKSAQDIDKEYLNYERFSEEYNNKLEAYRKKVKEKVKDDLHRNKPLIKRVRIFFRDIWKKNDQSEKI